VGINDACRRVLLAVGLVSSCTGFAAAKPCTVAGVFTAGSFSTFYFWVLQDRAGEISGTFQYVAWDVNVDVGPPPIRQFAAVSGNRTGAAIDLAVADPLGGLSVRKLHATLACIVPTKGDTTDGFLVFPLHRRDRVTTQGFSRSTGASPIPMFLNGVAAQSRSAYAIVQKPMRERVRHDPVLRAHFADTHARLLRGGADALDQMAATPQ
jgi:hypothetical protein